MEGAGDRVFCSVRKVHCDAVIIIRVDLQMIKLSGAGHHAERIGNGAEKVFLLGYLHRIVLYRKVSRQSKRKAKDHRALLVRRIDVFPVDGQPRVILTQIGCRSITDQHGIDREIRSRNGNPPARDCRIQSGHVFLNFVKIQRRFQIGSFAGFVGVNRRYHTRKNEQNEHIDDRPLML